MLECGGAELGWSPGRRHDESGTCHIVVNTPNNNFPTTLHPCWWVLSYGRIIGVYHVHVLFLACSFMS